MAAFLAIVALTWTLFRVLPGPAVNRGPGLGSFALGFMAATPLLTCIPDGSPWFDIVGNLVCILMVLGMLPAHPASNLSRSSYDFRSIPTPTASEEPTEEEPVVEKPAVPSAPPAVIPSPLAGTAETPRSKGRFVRRCEHVAQLYQLSPREHEVLVLLAKGRSMNHIKDTLVVNPHPPRLQEAQRPRAPRADRVDRVNRRGVDRTVGRSGEQNRRILANSRRIQ